MEYDEKIISLYKKNNITYIKFKILEKYKNIEHGFCIDKCLNFRTKDKFGNFYNKNINNYKIFLNLFNLNYNNAIKPIFKHTNNYKIVTKKYNNNKPDFNIHNYYATDALITNKKNFILTSTSADCNIILVYDPINNAIANIHSGWRGTLNKIIVNTINGMIKEYNTNPKDLICCICPSIKLCHFEVSDDLYMQFKDKIPNQKYYKYINNKWHIDLTNIIIDNLIDLNIKKENIIDSNICTMCNSNIMHSYRADNINSGLNMGFICLKGDNYDR